MIRIDLTNKTAIVTGASQGLGAAVAALFVQAGANVVVNYLNDDQGINKELAHGVVSKLGERAVAIAADVRCQTEVASMMEQLLARFGALDIVVNNAAILRDTTVKKMTDDDWNSVVETNLTGVYNCCKCAVDRLSDGGRIVNLASISACVGFFGQANYAAAKSGVIGLTKVLSRELAKRQITVNAVAPGVVLTEMGRSIPEQNRLQMLAQIPLNRFGEPEEVAAAILFLCSPLASYITGQVIHVNGGWWG